MQSPKTNGNGIIRVRLDRWHEYTVYTVFSLLTASGILWILFHYFVSKQGTFGRIPHPLEKLWLEIHGAVAMLTLLLLGTLLLVHMWRAWVSKINRWSGSTLFILNLFLIVTGYCLYYLGNEHVRAQISLLHWVTGLLLPLFLIVHVLSARKYAGNNGQRY